MGKKGDMCNIFNNKEIKKKDNGIVKKEVNKKS